MTEEIDIIESNPEMKLCKYVLIFEAKVWSIITLPLIVFKYINWCIAGSIFRLGCIPALIYIWFYQLMPLRVLDARGNPTAESMNAVAPWLIIFFILIVIGFIYLLHLILTGDDDSLKYIKSKWMWK